MTPDRPAEYASLQGFLAQTGEFKSGWRGWLRPKRGKMCGGLRLGPVVSRPLLIVMASASMALTAACSGSAPRRHGAVAAADRARLVVRRRHPVAASGDVTLAFAGDVHF